jgi:hypothetical protein
MGSVTTSHEMGLHEEQLAGRSQQMFFSATEEENFTYPWSYEVDYNKSAEFDAADMEISDINLKIRELMKSGHGTITVKNPRAKHSLGVGILNRLNLNFEGSLGYFGCGLTDGANIRITGRVGWSCAENMMAGTWLSKRTRVHCLVRRFVAAIWFVKARRVRVSVSIRKAEPSLSVVAWVPSPVS